MPAAIKRWVARVLVVFILTIALAIVWQSLIGESPDANVYFLMAVVSAIAVILGEGTLVTAKKCWLAWRK